MADSIDGISGVNSLLGSGSSPFTKARQDAMSAAAGELGMSATDLRSALVGGQTLEQIAAAKGVSSTDLQNTIETSLKKDLPNASSSQITNIAARMVSGPHHGGGHHAAGASSASGAPMGADGSTDGNDLGGSVSLDM